MRVLGNSHKMSLSYKHTHTHTFRNSSLCLFLQQVVLESQATVVCRLFKQMRHEPSAQSLHHPANCTSCVIHLLYTFCCAVCCQHSIYITQTNI